MNTRVLLVLENAVIVFLYCYALIELRTSGRFIRRGLMVWIEYTSVWGIVSRRQIKKSKTRKQVLHNIIIGTTSTNCFSVCSFVDSLRKLMWNGQNTGVCAECLSDWQQLHGNAPQLLLLFSLLYYRFFFCRNHHLFLL